MHRPRVLLIQRVLSHYRLKFFEALASRSTFDLELAYGDPHPASSVQSARAPSDLRPTRLRNFYLGRREIISYQGGLSRLIRAGGYDVVIAEFNPRIISNVMACLRSSRPTRFVWWGHGMGPNTGPLALWLRMRLAAMSDAVIFYDRTQADRFVELGLPAGKAHVAPNSIDTGGIAELRSAQGSEHRRNVVAIGRLIPEKRVDVLIRGYALARPALPADTTLVIIGDGPERDALMALSRQLGVDASVRFVGAVYDERVLAQHFNAARISVCMGKVGLNAIHSLAFGVPMIAARDARHAPEVTSLHAGETGEFTETADPQQLAQAIQPLLKDEQRWERMSSACIALVEKEYGIGAMTEAFERVILAAP